MDEHLTKEDDQKKNKDSIIKQNNHSKDKIGMNTTQIRKKH